jgi:hypothetical protein
VVFPVPGPPMTRTTPRVAASVISSGEAMPA